MYGFIFVPTLFCTKLWFCAMFKIDKYTFCPTLTHNILYKLYKVIYYNFIIIYTKKFPI